MDYDQESDDLFLFAEEKSKGSVELGNLIIDFNRNGKVVGLELLNATKFLQDSVNQEAKDYITKEFLINIKSCDVDIKQKNNFLFIKITLLKDDKYIFCPINAPLITETSPALAYA